MESGQTALNRNFGSCLAFWPSFRLSRESFSGIPVSLDPSGAGIGFSGFSVVELLFKRLSFRFDENILSGRAPWLHGRYPASPLL